MRLVEVTNVMGRICNIVTKLQHFLTAFRHLTLFPMSVKWSTGNKRFWNFGLQSLSKVMHGPAFTYLRGRPLMINDRGRRKVLKWISKTAEYFKPHQWSPLTTALQVINHLQKNHELCVTLDTDCCGQLWVWHMICGPTCDGLYHFAFCLVNLGYLTDPARSSLP